MSFDFNAWRSKGKAMADQAAEALRGQAAGVTDQAVRVAVDQALRVLAIAVEQVKATEPTPPPVSVGVGMSLGLFSIEVQVHVPRDGEPGEPTVGLKRAAPDDGGVGPGGPMGGGSSDVVP